MNLSIEYDKRAAKALEFMDRCLSGHGTAKDLQYARLGMDASGEASRRRGSKIAALNVGVKIAKAANISPEVQAQILWAEFANGSDVLESPEPLATIAATVYADKTPSEPPEPDKPPESLAKLGSKRPQSVR
jgi:hypothetical protein